MDNGMDEKSAELLRRPPRPAGKLSDYVHRCNDFRIHSTLGYMSPVEFRKAGLILSKPSK